MTITNRSGRSVYIEYIQNDERVKRIFQQFGPTHPGKVAPGTGSRLSDQLPIPMGGTYSLS
jgi:hypothetical protein